VVVNGVMMIVPKLLEIAPDDPRLSWPGAVCWLRTADGVAPWRAPVTELNLFPSEMHLAVAKPAGVRICFRTDSRSIRLAFRIEWSDVQDPNSIDLCCDGVVVASERLAGKEGLVFEDLPAGSKAVEIWLSPRARFWLRSLWLDAGATLELLADNRPRWIAYGSSITQSGAAASPTQTWPAIVARARDWNHTNLGYGGQGPLDTKGLGMMRSLPTDYISLCVGANIYGQASFSPRSFRPAIIGFVKLLREKHPDVPVTVMSPIWSLERETTPNPVGFTIRAMREEIAAAVETLRANGDASIFYVNGLDILGQEHESRIPDRLHPDAEGYRIMGRNFLAKAVPLIAG
jgi:hypothetical protein